MAFINATFYSNVLVQEVALDLYIPTDIAHKEPKKPDGIIYFLHGRGNSQRRFREYTAVNRYAMQNHLAVVYISAPGSFYVDMKYGFDYYTYITEELPAYLKIGYGLEFPREKTFLTGFSMGGYGTLKIGLSHPEMFGAIAPMSAPSNVKMMAETLKKVGRENAEGYSTLIFNAWGDELEIPQEDDPYFLLEKVSRLPADQQPRILMMCGKQDVMADIYKQSVAYDEYAQTLPLADYTFKAWKGVHDFTFWDRAMLHAVAFFKQNDYDVRELEFWRCDD